MKIPYIFASCLVVLPLGANGHKKNKPNEKPNILFICIDDLRRDLGCYGANVKSPNLDQLASEGSLFFNHYVQVPTSGASRASMLTGRLPRTNGDLNNSACESRITRRKDKTGPESLFHHLRNNGYYTVGIGKVSHSADGYIYGYTSPKSNRREMPESWDELLYDYGKWNSGWDAFFGYSNGTNRQGQKYQVKPYECAPCDDEGLQDGLTARIAVDKLKTLAKSEEPFCMVVGFYKPHLPFNSPKKYWDLYDEKEIGISPMPEIPENIYPNISLHSSGEFCGYRLGEEKPSLQNRVSDEYAKKVRHAYYACISYTDAQVGKVLQALKESGKMENTIIVVWGDHGWHLGDFRVWGKHTLYESALNSTFMMKVPGGKKGVKNTRIVSSVDIYPTLMDLCGVEAPEGLDGKSFKKLLTNPKDKKWEEAAYSSFGAGTSVRVPGYRLTRYRHKGKWLDVLFKYKNRRYETENIAEKYPKIVKQLLPIWEKGNLIQRK